LHTVAQKIPLEKILIETDAPFLALILIGKRNEPAYVNYTASKISELRNIAVNDFINQTAINAARLFCW
jgi:TatD DNase family protein